MKEELLKHEQQFDKYYLVAPGSDYGKAMWEDISCLDNAEILPQAIIKSSKLFQVLHHAHFSFAINRHIQLPFQHIWKNRYSLSHVEFKEDKHYCVIFTDVSAGRTDKRYLRELSEKKNVTLVLILVNTMHRRGDILKGRLGYFKLIYSFDRGDAEKYGFLYHPTNYSKLTLPIKKIENDAFYVGVSKGRLGTIHAIYKRIQDKEGTADFYVSGVSNREKKYRGIHYNEWLSYIDVINHIAKTNCIVEVMDAKQTGVTLRMMEAVCYNKRLFTNNQNVKNSPFYKTGYIYVFTETEDIDVEFIRDKSPVDYKYNDEFSPIHLIDSINRNAAEK